MDYKFHLALLCGRHDKTFDTMSEALAWHTGHRTATAEIPDDVELDLAATKPDASSRGYVPMLDEPVELDPPVWTIRDNRSDYAGEISDNKKPNDEVVQKVETVWGNEAAERYADEKCWLPPKEALTLVSDVYGLEIKTSEQMRKSPIAIEVENGELKITAVDDRMAPQGWFKPRGRDVLRFETEVLEPKQPPKQVDSVRYVVVNADPDQDAPDGDSCHQHAVDGWYVRQGKSWCKMSASEVRRVLRSDGVDLFKVDEVMGRMQKRDFWIRDITPSGKQYPGNRRWNLNRYWRVKAKKGPTPNYDAMCDRLFRELDLAVKDDDWCREFGITTGGQYLKTYLRYKHQHPALPMPLLHFFSSEQNSGGKSGIPWLIQNICASGAYHAENGGGKSDFNAELIGRIWWLWDETVPPGMNFNRLKSIIDNPKISAHPKGKDKFLVPNFVTPIYCSNELIDFIAPGDQRIVVADVEPVPGEPDPDYREKMLRPELEAIRWDWEFGELPERKGDRGGVPVLSTPSKLKSIEQACRRRGDKLLSFDFAARTLRRQLEARFNAGQEDGKDQSRPYAEMTAKEIFQLTKPATSEKSFTASLQNRAWGDALADHGICQQVAKKYSKQRRREISIYRLFLPEHSNIGN